MRIFRSSLGLLTLITAFHGAAALAVEVKTKPEVKPEAFQALSSAPDGDWRPVKTDARRGIRTWAKMEDDKPWRSFRLEATLNTTMPALESVFSNFDQYPAWYWQAMEVRLLKAVSATEFYLYMVQNEPVNLPDRDVVLHVQIEPVTQKHPFASIRMKAVSDYLPAKPPLVRMKDEELMITLQPQADGVLLKAEGFTHPGGVMPLWASNYAQRTAPFAMAVALERMTLRQAASGAGTAATSGPKPFRLSLAQ
ncbi:MAG: hypothetical protein Q7T36_16580 [Fluviicoccus sp.]|uniref:hypothetical protein n=1 Tax=Fluviicoccus sp. TaxID=2003552 RepID=UPI002718FB98|nr:hypothetical protein [Fluviicoccus sp.]MDO8332082.1 hypothetical protein [Fluviicoccus sp.]